MEKEKPPLSMQMAGYFAVASVVNGTMPYPEHPGKWFITFHLAIAAIALGGTLISVGFYARWYVGNRRRQSPLA